MKNIIDIPFKPSEESILPSMCKTLLNLDEITFEECVYKNFLSTKSALSQFEIGCELTKFNSNKYKHEVLTVAFNIIDDKKDNNAEEWIKNNFNKNDNLQIIHRNIDKGLQLKDREGIKPYLSLAISFNINLSKEKILELSKHKAIIVKSKVVEIIVAQEKDAFNLAIELIKDKKADVRLLAAMVLIKLNSDKAIEILKTHLNTEKIDRVRNPILDALSPILKKESKTYTINEIQEKIDISTNKIKNSPLKWVQEETLPPLYLENGEELNIKKIRYLFYRQSQEKKIKADIEAELLYRIIDKKTSGRFAEYLLKGFIDNESNPKEKWILALVGILGNDKIIPTLTDHIYKMVKKNRGRIAEYMVYALALIGTDYALSELDKIRKSRIKTTYINISKLAQQAFNNATEKN